MQYHANTSAQIQSVLSAERQQHQQNLKEQAKRWQQSLDIVTEGAQEEILERNDTIKELTQYLEEIAQELEHYEEWCDSYHQQLAFTETNQLFQDFNRDEDSEAEAQAQKPLLSTAPLTPPVCFGSSLTTQHLPPPTLPFQRACPSNPQRLEKQQEQIAAEEKAARASQQWEAHRDAELREALSKIQRLEESQQASVGGQAPTLPTTQAYTPGNTTGLTIGQASPVLPSSANRGPWAATRERFHPIGADKRSGSLALRSRHAKRGYQPNEAKCLALVKHNPSVKAINNKSRISQDQDCICQFVLPALRGATAPMASVFPSECQAGGHFEDLVLKQHVL